MTTNERLTWPEICRRYPDEWVVVVEIQLMDGGEGEVDHSEALDEDDHVRCARIADSTAVVFAHHKTRKGASPAVKAAFERYTEVGKFWTGGHVAPARRFVAG
jgi:hypothetical protein